MSQHSVYSPSQLPRIIRCPGSIKATAGMTSSSSPYAKEGTMLHEVTEQALLLDQSKLSPDLIDQYELNKEQIDAVNDCLDFVFVLMAKHESEPYMFVEKRVSLKGYTDALNCAELEDVYGTLDLLISYPNERILYVIDWKFGKGIEVFPDSEQLMAYGLAALNKPELHTNFDEVRIIVGQPRLYSGELFKTEVFAPVELYNWAKDKLVPAIMDAKSHHPTLNPSDKACQWCLIKRTCEARLAQAQATAVSVFEAHAKLPNQVSIQEICSFLAKARDLKSYIADLELFVANSYKKGKETPGWKMVAGRSIRGWATKDEEGRPEEFFEWAESHGYSEFDLSTLKPPSPTQAEKIIGRELAKTDEFKALVVKPEGKPTLVPDTDKREPLKYSNASEVFADFKS